MTPEEARAHVGERVVYAPYPGVRETGRIERVGTSLVMVEYDAPGGGAPSVKATYPRDLALLDPAELDLAPVRMDRRQYSEGDLAWLEAGDNLLRLVNYLRDPAVTSERRVDLFSGLWRVSPAFILRIGHDARLLTPAEEARYAEMLVP